jgi:hypothetical protein
MGKVVKKEGQKEYCNSARNNPAPKYYRRQSESMTEKSDPNIDSNLSYSKYPLCHISTEKYIST